jgi:predicted anti-sigma-YlaC factor YlaD
MFEWIDRGCRKYQGRMEECLGAAHLAESDPELAAHLTECSPCREAFAAAELSARLFSEGAMPPVPSDEAFVTRVMATIRQHDAMDAAPAAVWRLLESFASRFALVASIALLALSVFLGEVSPALRQTETVATGVIGTAISTEVTGDWPEPPAQPATQDEVLLSLVDADNGI